MAKARQKENVKGKSKNESLVDEAQLEIRFSFAFYLFTFAFVNMAERVGFEPTERFPVHSISSAANSTTLAPLRNCRLPIGHYVDVTRLAKDQSAIGNRQSQIDNVLAERVGFEPT